MNPRIKKIAHNIFFLLSVPVIIGAFVFAQQSSRTELYKGMKVFIQNPELSFVSEKEVIETIEEQGIMANKITLNDIDIKVVKGEIERNIWVEKAEIFVSAKQVMHVRVVQRTPIARVQLRDSMGKAYYLDANANPMPLSEQYVANVPVFTTDDIGYKKDDLDFKSNLVSMSNFIQKDSFWNAALTQIDIEENQSLRLIPAIGNQTILFGSIENHEDKLNRLKTFYQNGIKTVDWNLYDELDARYSGQIVCRNTKGLVLAEDPYESKADAQERIRIKTSIEKEEARIAKEKAKQEEQKAKVKALKAKQEAELKQKEALQLAKEKALQLKQEAKEKARLEKELSAQRKEQNKKTNK